MKKSGSADKQQAIKALTELAQRAENVFIPQDNAEALIAKEREECWRYSGETVFGDAQPPARRAKNVQLRLF